MSAQRGVERTYDVAADTSLPSVLRLPDVASVQVPEEQAPEAVYFDTDQQDLTRAGATLRRRAGGVDDGWDLTLPVARGEREEIRHPIHEGGSETAAPDELDSLVQVHARGHGLKPVATVRTRRVVHRLGAKDGTALAELWDENVTSAVTHEDGSVTTTGWRQWVFQLVEGPPKLLTAADRLFREAGARPGRDSLRLARAIGVPDPTSVKRLAPGRSAKEPAGVVVLSLLRGQVDTLKTLDPRVRRDLPDAVHTMRVSTRRLRSALASFEPLLDAEQTDALREELRWLADVLGGARDAEVTRDRLTAMAAENSPSDVATQTGPPGQAGLTEGLTAELEARYRAAHDEVLQVLDSRRYFRLLDLLDGLVESPPWTTAAEGRARKVLPRLVRRDWRRVRKHAVAADHADDARERDLELHEVRKAAKRLRYACEALTPVFGANASDLGDAAKGLQEVLGEHQDSVVSQDLLRELADRHGLTGDAALTLGRLRLAEQGHAERARGNYDAAWVRMSDKRLRRWLEG